MKTRWGHWVLIGALAAPSSALAIGHTPTAVTHPAGLAAQPHFAATRTRLGRGLQRAGTALSRGGARVTRLGASLRVRGTRMVHAAAGTLPEVHGGGRYLVAGVPTQASYDYAARVDAPGTMTIRVDLTPAQEDMLRSGLHPTYAAERPYVFQQYNAPVARPLAQPGRIEVWHEPSSHGRGTVKVFRIHETAGHPFGDAQRSELMHAFAGAPAS